MKNIILTLIAAFIFSGITYGQGQNEFDTKVKLYKVWIKTEREKVKGFLYAVDERGMSISKTKKIDLEKLQFVPAEKIRVIKLRKRGTVFRSSLIGGLSGAVLFYGLGMTGSEKSSEFSIFTKEDIASMAAIVLSIPSGIIGALIGTGRKKFIIDYSSDTYLKQLPIIEKHAIKYQFGS